MTKNTICLTLLSYIGLWAPLLSVIYIGVVSGSLRFFVAFGVWSILIVLITSLFRKKRIYLISLFAFTIVFSALVFIDLVHHTLFKNSITASTLYILLETNRSETLEFLKMYFRAKFQIIGIGYLVVVLVGAFYSRQKYTQIRKWRDAILKKRIYTIAGIIVLLMVLALFRHHFLPYVITKSVMEFREERRNLSQMSITKKGNFGKVSHVSDSRKETYVLIIGESTTNTHMGLYGYYRETNPLLTSRQNTLHVFDNVKSPHTHTISSLGKALTVGDHKVPEQKFNHTIIQLFNSADFTTYFISNQNPIGQYETTVTLISKMSDKSFFTNTSRSVFDEAILVHLKNALAEQDKKKFIIIHLMGTHSYYANRYPQEFDVFKDNPKTQFNHELAYQTINEYDNAVLYNDYMVNSIISEVESNSAKSYVLYFSDHGEDVYETIDEACHTEEKGTEPMYRIPFVLWFSDFYDTSQTHFVWDTTRQFNLKNLPHTVADLSGLHFGEFDPTKSVVNPDYNITKENHIEPN